jgi:LysM repeat protein
MVAAGVFLLFAAAILGYNLLPEDDGSTATINDKLETIGAQSEGLSFGASEKLVLGETTSVEVEASQSEPETDTATPAEPAVKSTPTDNNFTSYTVKSGDTLFNISQEYGIKWDLIAQFNNLSEPYMLHGGQVLRIPQTTTSTVPDKIYTIVKGDTLASIAKKYNITVNDIIAVNPNLQQSDLISIGQVIKLP